MGGECEQDNNFWCPLKSSDCAKGKLSKCCVLLYSATHASIALARLHKTYVLEDGTMTLKENRDPSSP